MGNKWFAERAGDATSWGKWFFKSDKQPFFTLRVEVPNSVAQQMKRVLKLDGIGPARSAQGAVLDAINQQGTFTVLRGNVLP